MKFIICYKTMALSVLFLTSTSLRASAFIHGKNAYSSKNVNNSIARHIFSLSFSSSSIKPAEESTTSYLHLSNMREVLQYHQQQQSSLSPITTTLLLDMWGVMHDGSKPYDGVLETIQQLRQLDDVRIVILSNSSKRLSHSFKMLRKLGFDPEVDFDQVITSGEVSHQMLSFDDSLLCERWSVLDSIETKSVFVFGSGSEDEEYVQSAGWTLAPIEEAGLIVARGTFTINDGKTITSKKDGEEKYFEVLDEILEIAAERGVPMLVSNPDKVRPDEGLPPMPGAIADSYESKLLSYEKNGKEYIKRIGKPFREVYDLALGQTSDSSSAIMIGDALDTDVSGGINIGCSSVWVINDGIHNDDVKSLGENDFTTGVQEVVKTFNNSNNKNLKDIGFIEPTFVVPHFRW